LSGAGKVPCQVALACDFRFTQRSFAQPLSNVSRRRPEHFDRETMLLWLRARQAAGESLIYTEVCLEHRDKALAIRRTFGSWQRAVDEARDLG